MSSNLSQHFIYNTFKVDKQKLLNKTKLFNIISCCYFIHHWTFNTLKLL